MAESTLSINFDALQKEIGGFLGYTRTVASYTTEQKEEILSYMDSGIRQFLFPPPDARGYVHQWSFLSPVTSMVAWKDVAVSTVLATGVYDAATYTVITATSASFYSNMVGKSIVVTGVGTYPIAVYTSSTVIKILGDHAFAGRTFSIEGDATYDLPDNIGGIYGVLTFEPDAGSPPVVLVDESQIRDLRQLGETTGQPLYVAIRPKTQSTLTVGQRWEAIFYPWPSENYTFYFKGVYLFNQIATTQYPQGGMPHAETILESCLAIAEQRGDDALGLHTMKFKERLGASIEYDASLAPERLGLNTDRTIGATVVLRHHDFYYNGVLISG